MEWRIVRLLKCITKKTPKFYFSVWVSIHESIMAWIIAGYVWIEMLEPLSLHSQNNRLRYHLYWSIEWMVLSKILNNPRSCKFKVGSGCLVWIWNPVQTSQEVQNRERIHGTGLPVTHPKEAKATMTAAFSPKFQHVTAMDQGEVQVEQVWTCLMGKAL